MNKNTIQSSPLLVRACSRFPGRSGHGVSDKGLLVIGESAVRLTSEVAPCCFLRRYEKLLTPELTVQEARGFTTHCVYVVIAPDEIPYGKSSSRVKYIGYTKNPKRRFQSHTKIEPGDRVRLIDLAAALKVIRRVHRAHWCSMSLREQEAFAKQPESILLRDFLHRFGSLPQSNSRKESLQTQLDYLTWLFFFERRAGRRQPPQPELPCKRQRGSAAE